MKKITTVLDHLIRVVIILATAGMLGVICLQIFCRFILNDALSWPEEAARFLMIWSLFLAGGYALKDREHIGLTFFANRLPERIRAFMTVILHLFIIGFLCVVVIGGCQEVISLMPLKTGALRISRAVPYLIMPISGVFYIAVSARLLIEDLRLIIKDNPGVRSK